MPQPRYVVDTTVLVAWLLKPNGLTGKIVRSLEFELYTPSKSVDELFKHKEEWSGKNPDVDFGRFVEQLEQFVRITEVDQHSSLTVEAKNIMGRIDPDDAEFVALAMQLDAPVWSYDPHFRVQHRVDVVDGKDMLLRSMEVPSLRESLKDELSNQTKRR